MGSHMPNDGFDWSDPQFSTSDYWAWDVVGKEIAGTLREISTHTFEAKQMPDGTTSKAKTVPVLHLDVADGQAVEITCSNADLLEQIKAQAPQVGDSVGIKYLRDVPTSFGGKKKLFYVLVTRAVQATPAFTPTTASYGQAAF